MPDNSANAKVFVPSGAGYPFSNAVRVGDTVYVSGQIAFLADGTVSTGSIEVQTTIVLEAIRSILANVDCELTDIVKCGCTLQDARDFDAFNRTYATFFPTNPPVRTTTVLQHVLDARVEIDCIAYRLPRPDH